MRRRCSIGLDIGLSATKAVAYLPDGREIAAATRDTVNSQPHHRWVEREPQAFRESVMELLAELVGKLTGNYELAIAPTAHGDGLWLFGADHQLLRPGILSLDSRARSTLEPFLREPSAGRLTQLTGQLPLVASAGTLLAWLKANEPEVYAAAAAVAFTKDVVRFWLTGEIAFEFTEASSGFTAVASQQVDRGALELMGVGEAWELVPPVALPTEQIGVITPQVAERTGLAAGTPVAAGLHDIMACAVGQGVVGAGGCSVIAGTYCVNQLIWDSPELGDWLTRSGTAPGLWNLLVASPSSSTNLNWFAGTMTPELVAASEQAGGGQWGFLPGLLEELEPLGAESPYYLPFLFGSPLPQDASAAVLGLRPWHSRGDVLRGVLEGIALNHRFHLDKLPLPESTTPQVAGGVSRSPVWAQMMADTLDRPIAITAKGETGALGAAAAAWVAAGQYDDLREATGAMVRPGQLVEPGPGAALAQERFQRYTELLEALGPWWG